MRELKFKAYDTIKKKWVHPFDKDESEGCCIWDLLTGSCEYEYLIFNDVYPHIEIVQFANKRDIDNNELYAGDICNFTVPASVYGLNTPDSMIGEIKWDDEDAGWYFLSNNSKFPHVKFYFADNIKRIGHIFENPDLLEVK